MNFKYWLEQSEDDLQDKAERYFTLGHGDDDEAYVVWAIVNGIVKTSRKFRGDAEGTHGSLWGHDVTDSGFKGRYEPNTGRLSIVIPTSLIQAAKLDPKLIQHSVSQEVLPKLEKKFRIKFDRNKIEVF
jgi:hypothetical protein